MKTVYLGRKKRNRRVDRLISVLVDDVKSDYIYNICRITLNVGRMDPEERRRRELALTLTSLNNVDDFHYKINAYFLKAMSQSYI